jgi:DNA-binding NarL/FixJ family response regulator
VPGTERSITVLVVDDQVLIRAGLVALLRAAPGVEVVGEAADGETAVTLAARTRPQVILMDIRMPGAGGIAATRQILAAADEAHRPRVLVLTTFDLDEYVYQALRAGASGFLLKDSPPERLLNAVATVAGGDLLFAPSVVRGLVEAYAARSAPRPGTVVGHDALTGREVEVLRLVARGMSNTEIAERLVIAEATVKTHVNRTMTKLGLTSRAQAVVVAYETGLVVPQHGHPA